MNVTVHLTTAQTLNLFSAPIVLVPGAVGDAYVPRKVTVRLNFGTVAFDQNGLLFVGCPTWTQNQSIGLADSGLALASAADSISALLSPPDNGATPTPTAALSGAALVLGLTNADPTTGDGDLDVTVEYDVIPA